MFKKHNVYVSFLTNKRNLLSIIITEHKNNNMYMNQSSYMRQIPPPIGSNMGYASSQMMIQQQQSTFMPPPIGSSVNNTQPPPQMYTLPAIGIGLGNVSFKQEEKQEVLRPQPPPPPQQIESNAFNQPFIPNSIQNPIQLTENICTFIPMTQEQVDGWALFNRHKQQRIMKNPITSVFVAFVLGDHTKCKSFGKRVVNQIVEVSGEYTHCEIVFKLRSGHYIACSIYMDDVVKMEIKPYSMNKWRTLGIDLTQNEAQDAFDYCLEQLGKKFNMTGIALSFIPGLSYLASYFNGNEQTFFCTELVLRALQRAKPLKFNKPEYVPARTTPTMLYNILKQENALVLNTLEDIRTVQMDLV